MKLREELLHNVLGVGDERLRESEVRLWHTVTTAEAQGQAVKGKGEAVGKQWGAIGGLTWLGCLPFQHCRPPSPLIAIGLGVPSACRCNRRAPAPARRSRRPARPPELKS